VLIFFADSLNPRRSQRLKALVLAKKEKTLTAECAEQIAKDAEKFDYTNYEFAETGFLQELYRC